MKNKHAALPIKNTDQIKSENPEDINSVFVTCFDELLSPENYFK